ncbi:MAG: hypothetical protein US97_C0013G0005 [Microgenomates group bacterium GW2011_GWF1_38_5]|nr:MAG: hypothetical protein US97_C0013G0005 [Microgenomates group bacterium GW2011_GWF1_38_5]
MARDTRAIQVRLEGRNREYVQLDEYPDKCAACGNGGQPKYLTGHSLGDAWDYNEVVEAVFQCPSNKCNRYYTAIYTKPDRMGDYFFLKRTLAPQYWEPIKFSDEITEVSPRFPRIYNQSAIAEDFGLDEIAGGGYRKSLEFLIKDYLKATKLRTEEQIKKMQLADAISAINEKRIQACAKRAAWLGNDEIHYERKWEDKDITNLKELIKLTVNFVESDIIAGRYEEEMPDNK